MNAVTGPQPCDNAAILETMRIAASGMRAAATRAANASNNIANVHSAGAVNEDGYDGYVPTQVVQLTQEGGGVETTLEPRSPAYRPAYQPSHPAANEQGIVGVPNTDYVPNFVELSQARMAYAAGAAVIRTAEQMARVAFSMKA